MARNYTMGSIGSGFESSFKNLGSTMGKSGVSSRNGYQTMGNYQDPSWLYSQGAEQQRQSERMSDYARGNIRNNKAQAIGIMGTGAGLMGDYSTYAPGAYQQMASLARYNPEYQTDVASADVGMAYDKAGDIKEREMQRMGINPTSARYQGLKQQMNLARAAAEAGARTRARREGLDTSFNRSAQMANLLQRLPGEAARFTGMGAGMLESVPRQQMALGEQYASRAGDYTGMGLWSELNRGQGQNYGVQSPRQAVATSPVATNEGIDNSLNNFFGSMDRANANRPAISQPAISQPVSAQPQVVTAPNQFNPNVTYPSRKNSTSQSGMIVAPEGVIIGGGIENLHKDSRGAYDDAFNNNREKAYEKMGLDWYSSQAPSVRKERENSKRNMIIDTMPIPTPRETSEQYYDWFLSNNYV